MNEESKQIKKTYHYDTLVLSGGSVKGIMTLGSLQYIFDTTNIEDIKLYIGTSSGAIICFLLSIGYNPSEILAYICVNQLMEKIQHFNIVAMINGSGASSFISIYEQIEKMTIDKIGYIPTLLDIKKNFNKELIFVTYNITENKTEYLSYENYPNLPCLIGLRMSSNLPLIFENYKYGNNLYIDGGVSDNFPIDIGDKKGNKVLGINIETLNISNSGSNIIEFIYKLMFIPITQTTEHKISNVSDKCKIITLKDNLSQNTFNFNITTVNKLELFSSAYSQIKNQY